MLFKKYIDFYKTVKEKELKTSSFYKYNGILNNYIYPYFSNLTCKEANNIHNIRKFFLDVDNLSSKGNITNKTKKDILTVLKGCLEEAFYDEQIEKSNIKYLRPIKSDKFNINPFSKKEVNQLIRNATGYFKIFLAIGFYTGLRTGEIIALYKSDIDFKKNIIHVNKTRDRFGEGTPKTKTSIRDVPIFIPLKSILKEYLSLSVNKKYLFVNQYNEPFNSTKNINERHYKPLLKKCGLKYRRLYETRHTFATNMLSSGKFNVNEIARMLGHTNTQMLFQKYTAYIESENRYINNSLNIYF